jgi:hypothetical protein
MVKIEFMIPAGRSAGNQATLASIKRVGGGGLGPGFL